MQCTQYHTDMNYTYLHPPLTVRCLANWEECLLSPSAGHQLGARALAKSIEDMFSLAVLWLRTAGLAGRVPCTAAPV